MNDSPAARNGSIGIFDSGVGGLSVLQQIRSLLPSENILYFADQHHVPYGPRPVEEIQEFAREISHFLIEQGTKLVVVACNTASAAALDHLRAAIPEISFVGMEPAIKPGSVKTRSGRVGVLATVGTFDSTRYANLMTRFAQAITVYENPCIGLVEQIEAGILDGPETERILLDAWEPMRRAGVDTLVLGCTHYPFVSPLLKELVGTGVTVIDPSPAVARQVRRVLRTQNFLNDSGQDGDIQTYTTGVAGKFSEIGHQLLGEPIPVIQASWSNGSIYAR